MRASVILVLSCTIGSCFSQSNRTPEGNAHSTPPATTNETEKKDRCDFSSFKPIQVSHFVRSNLKERYVPEYPKEAILRNVQGIVSVKILVDGNGSVVKACALDGHPDLVPTAEEAALKWKFKRKVVSGHESFVSAGITFRFVLDGVKEDQSIAVDVKVSPKPPER